MAARLRISCVRVPGYGPEMVRSVTGGANNCTRFWLKTCCRAETVDPTDPANKFFDDELCHEWATALSISNPGANTPCTQGAPSGTYTTMASTSPGTGTTAAINYKWVRVTLKQNGTLPTYAVDSAAAAAAQVCWDNYDVHEHIINTSNTPGPLAQPSEFELAALRQAIEQGFGAQAVFAFGGKAKGNSATGTASTGTASTGTASTGTASTGTASTGTASTGTASTGTASTGTASTGTASTGTASTGTASTGTASTGSGGAGAFSNDPCNATNIDRYSVYLVTALAITPGGARRMTQYEISKNPFPPIPGSLTFNGSAANFSPPNSAGFRINGNDSAVANATENCGGPRGAVDAVAAGSQAAADSLKAAVTRPANYLGLSPAPDIVDGSTVTMSNGETLLQRWDTVAENQAIVAQFTASADNLLPSGGSAGSITTADPACQSVALGTTFGDTSVPVQCRGPKVTVAQGNFTIGGSTSGHGVLVVTGDLTINGNVSWDGVILVIGTGVLRISGGGGATYNGAIMVTNTVNSPDGVALGAPTVDWSGGGGHDLNYNSCAIANAFGGASYRVITYREMTY